MCVYRKQTAKRNLNKTIYNMETKLTSNNHKETLEACLTDTLWIENEEIQNFCRDMFKRHESNIVEVDGVSTGGGFYHLLFRLKDGHLIVMHTTDNIWEETHEAWESIDDYFTQSDLHARGFGWEYDYPNYEDRCHQMV